MTTTTEIPRRVRKNQRAGTCTGDALLLPASARALHSHPAGIQAHDTGSPAGPARGGSSPNAAPRRSREATMDDWPLDIRMLAFAAAMAARAGTLDRAQIDELEAAVRPLDRDNQLRVAVEGFVAKARDALRDRARLADLGRDMGRYVDSLLIVRPPDLDRRDVHG